MIRRLQIAEPCSREWEAMSGDDRVRHCEGCEKEVRDLSALDAEEAERVLERASSVSLCLRILHDDEGNVRFRQAEGRAQRWVLAVGASAALAACAPPSLPHDVAPAPRVEHPVPSPEAQGALVDAEPAGKVDEAPPPLAGGDPMRTMSGDPPTRPPTEPVLPAAAKPLPAKPAAAKSNQAPLKKGEHQTTGCVCVPEEPLCAC